jgi:Cdc6-like AAA superfamily ATPase
MLQGKREFVLIDDQKVVYETIIAQATDESENQKRVIIVDGGPGTGKSVVAINLLAALTAKELLVKYVTKNRAPRQVFEQTLSGAYRRSRIASLFAGSGEFIETPINTFDALIVDEAHRLNEKSGIYSNLGSNQIEEIIRAARCSIFFIDEDQRVTWKDIGQKSEIERWAQRAGAAVTHLQLESQFRCSGSDGYLAWLDQVLGIRETANPVLESDEFDFRVLDSPTEVRRLVILPFLAEAKSGMRLRGHSQLLRRGDAAESHVRSFVVVRPEPASSSVLNFLDRSEQHLC